MDETVLQEVSHVLQALSSDKPWMTAAGLSRKIKARTGHVLRVARIESTLIEHSQSPERAIRYSYYPSKRTLDILWGHVDLVGEKRNLPELDRIDEPSEYKECESVAENAPWFFVSHNHLDFGDALKLRRLITKKGCGAWLFEAEIPQGGAIAESASRGIKECSSFLSYVTRRSIGSLWVRKEMEAAGSHDCERHVVVDGRDKDLLRLFEEWTGGWPPSGEGTLEFCSSAARELGLSPQSVWTHRCTAFIDSLHDLLGNTNQLLAYPALPESIPWGGRRLAIQSFEEFLATAV